MGVSPFALQLSDHVGRFLRGSTTGGQGNHRQSFKHYGTNLHSNECYANFGCHLKYINYRAFHDKSNDSGGGSISSIYEALLAERGLIITERLKKAVATPER